MEEVGKVLDEIGAHDVPQIVVMNKIDLTGVEPAVALDECGNISRVSLSARTGAGIDLLRQALVLFAQDRRRQDLQQTENGQDGLE
jgi:GTP-binding protein HflX